MSDQKVTVIGLGHAGIAVLDAALAHLPDDAATVAVDCDRTVLADSAAEAKIALDRSRTCGSGTGGDPRAGRACAEEHLAELEKVASGADFVFLFTGLGGGMVGAAPFLLNAAREGGAVTLCLGILPAQFEGDTRRERADEAVASLRASADAILAVPNDRLLDHVDGENVASGFERANRLVADAVRGVWQLVTKPGYVRVGPAEIQRAARMGGACTFSFGEGRGRNRAATAATAALESPLVEHGGALAKARCVLVGVAGGNGLAVREIGDIVDLVGKHVSAETEVLVGTALDESWRNRVGVVLLVAERSGPVEPVSSPVETDDATATRRAVREAPEASVPRSSSRRKSKREAQQAKLRLDMTGKGRFKDIEPTIMDGEDLDIPTFIRRNLSVDR